MISSAYWASGDRPLPGRRTVPTKPLTACSGKGTAATLVSCAYHGFMHSYQYHGDLTSLISELNRFIIRSFELEKYVTGVFMDLDAATGQLTGHDAA
jgi:serine phosphatase RsbU (regulator of sigma subunit)